MEQYFRSVMSGEKTGVFASLLRSTSRIIEPIYRAVVESRNASFSRGARKANRVGRPVISVGNITTGGTGKTPVVAWLARELRSRNRNVAILMRGYKSTSPGISDEQKLLSNILNTNPAEPQIPVHVNPDRTKGAAEVLRDHPNTDVFILDDGFQHRSVYRDFDLVLIDATNPFGFDHVLPRGLLREPMSSMSRANAILLTRVDQALPDELPEIEQALKRHAPHVPVYRCKHVHLRLIGARDAESPQSMTALAGQNVFAFGGIGNPQAFERQLQQSCNVAAHRWFADHHAYDRADLSALRYAARNAGTSAMITTEKDWVKLAPIVAQNPDASSVPILRVQMEIQFVGNDERKLLDQLLAVAADGTPSVSNTR